MCDVATAVFFNDHKAGANQCLLCGGDDRLNWGCNINMQGVGLFSRDKGGTGDSVNRCGHTSRWVRSDSRCAGDIRDIVDNSGGNGCCVGHVIGKRHLMCADITVCRHFIAKKR